MKTPLNIAEKRGKMLAVRDGYVICPTCKSIHPKLMELEPDTVAFRVHLYCRHCKTRYIVNIDKGQCFESRSQ